MGGRGSGGHNKKPVEEHLRLGNFRPSRHGQRPVPPPEPEQPLTVLPTVPAEAPEPLRPLGRVGLQLWTRVVGLPWLLPTDREALQLLCETSDDRQMLRVRVLREQRHAEDEGLPLPRDHDRARSLLRQHDELVNSLLHKLGLTPDGRAQLGTAALDAVARASKLDALRRAGARPARAGQTRQPRPSSV